MTTSVTAQTPASNAAATYEQLERAEQRKNRAMITSIACCILCPLIIGGTIWFEGMRNNQEGIAAAGLAIVIIGGAFDAVLALFLFTFKCALGSGVGH